MRIGIAVFVYNRLDHAKRMLDALVKSDHFSEYDTYLFSDAAKPNCVQAVAELREYIHSFVKDYPSIKVIEAETNRGCKGNIVFGIGYVLDRYDAVISVEDDVVVGTLFLDDMKLLLEKYQSEDRIGEIAGYKYPDLLFQIPRNYPYDVFFMNRTSSWGWATWKNRWEAIDWELKDLERFRNDLDAQQRFNTGGGDLSTMLLEEGEWDLIWAYHNFKKGRLTVYPTESFVENIGVDGSGIHCAGGDEEIWEMPELNTQLPQKFPEEIKVDKNIQRNFQNVFSKGFYGKVRGLKKRAYKLFRGILK